MRRGLGLRRQDIQRLPQRQTLQGLAQAVRRNEQLNRRSARSNTRPFARRNSGPRNNAGQAYLRAETAYTQRVRVQAAYKARQEIQSSHTNGQPRQLVRLVPPGYGMDTRRGDRRRVRGILLDRPSHLASRAGRAQGRSARSNDARLGLVHRPGRETPLRSGLHAVELARVLGLRHRRARRHGLPYNGPALLGARPQIPHKRGGQFHAGQPVLAPAGTGSDIQVPGTSRKGQGENAAPHGVLVRRRPRAATPRGTQGRRNDGRRERGNHLRGQAQRAR